MWCLKRHLLHLYWLVSACTYLQSYFKSPTSSYLSLCPYVDGTRMANSLNPGIFRTSVPKRSICPRLLLRRNRWKNVHPLTRRCITYVWYYYGRFIAGIPRRPILSRKGVFSSPPLLPVISWTYS